MSGKISLVDVLIGTACLAILGSLLVQGTARRRAAARSEACATNLQRIGLALRNYHSGYKQVPMGSGGTHNTGNPTTGNGYRLGPLVALLPFAEEQALWEEISNTYISKRTNKPFPRMGPVPLHDSTEYEPWGKRPAIFVCPDDPEASKQSPRHSYVSCYGDGTFEVGAPSGLILPYDPKRLLRDIVPGYHDPYTTEGASIVHATRRGAFMRTNASKFRDCLDGLSNTVYMSETQIGLRIADAVDGMSRNPSKAIDVAQTEIQKWASVTRGQCWAGGSLAIGGFQTILPPNSPSAISPKGELDGIISASSHHADGVHVLMGDGGVHFVSNDIDAGDPTAPGINIGDGYGNPGSTSPYGVWGALGTIANKETINSSEALFAVINEVKPPLNHMPRRHEFRTWTDNSGTKRFKARFVRIIDRQRVEMEMDDGERVEVPINRLSNVDAYDAIVLSLVELSPVEQRKLQEDFNLPAAGNSKETTHELRVWTDNSGTKRIKARYVRIVDRQRVEMEMEDGERVEVPINRLSNADSYYAVVEDFNLQFGNNRVDAGGKQQLNEATELQEYERAMRGKQPPTKQTNDFRQYEREMAVNMPEVQFPSPDHRGRIEAERMNWESVSSGKLIHQDMTSWKDASWSNNRQILWLGPGPTDSLRLGFRILETGEYEVSGVLTKAPDFAIARIMLDNDVLVSKVDSYDARVQPSEKISFGIHTVKSGHHSLVITIMGRNPSNVADDLGFGIDYIEFTRRQTEIETGRANGKR